MASFNSWLIGRLSILLKFSKAARSAPSILKVKGVRGMAKVSSI
jgi:hypothetical protein